MSGAGRARPLVLAAPSGTGKTTIARALVEGSDDFGFSVSATTRAPRPGERDGVDYHFVSRERFREMAESGALAEWATVHGELYGTPRAALDEAAERGEHVVLDIDVQGAAQLRERIPDALLVFVLPPSVETLLARLTGRGTERAEEVAERLRSALRELETAPDFDHVIVNHEVDASVEAVKRLMRGGDDASLPSETLREEIEAMRAEIRRVLDTEFENTET